VLNKYQSVTHVSTLIFLIIKFLDFWLSSQKVLGYFIFFFTMIELFTALYPTLCIKKMFTKNPLNLYSLKATKFNSHSVKNKSARAKKKLLLGGGDAPPSACIKL